ncbi:MAG: bacillithiol system redox-active protein YtxJ [Gemmatimonadetes bacterium]|nr:bacillithiol system redox-active protein YtxJ [Gemmatimonadota bacterium]MYD25296.1 bacillithiol system redox-active protein YtxJ [Gemmatimonadota bacterium]MYI99920.1 bacillithiol system redox-active protein YtxJ [Gemmatimonadota bacterium]
MSDRVVRLTGLSALDEVIASSSERPVFVYKHSTVCPVSARAADQYHDFADDFADVDEDMDTDPSTPLFTQVMVIENRDLSNEIESRLGIRHESPQLLLLRDGKVTWHASHFSISGKSIKSALED